ncbi:MAG: hypothetical protein HUK01_08815 [Bacteroidaceae bacterium]|nr:hypothetical protein [Bacteroidaceae bacterium]
MASAERTKPVRSAEDQAILDGFREAILEWKEIKAGRSQGTPHDEAMAQIRTELEAEGYGLD